MSTIIFDFKDVQLEAELFDTAVAARFYDSLPYTIDLTHWGKEMYGSIGLNLGAEKPVPEIPPGGLAYTKKGNYLCIFYGQNPAWPVAYIGDVTGDWQGKLSSKYSSVTVRAKD